MSQVPIIFLAVIAFGIMSGCKSYPKIERDETLNSEDSIICVAANAVIGTKTPPPKNAGLYRTIAKMYPRDDKFGPPPSQQKLPGEKWDLTNEFWYLTGSGELFLYSNSDDGYQYFWQFDTLPKAKLKRHGLLFCAD